MQQAEVDAKMADLLNRSDDGDDAYAELDALLRPHLDQLMKQMDDPEAADPYAWHRAIVELHALCGAIVRHTSSDFDTELNGFNPTVYN